MSMEVTRPSGQTFGLDTPAYNSPVASPSSTGNRQGSGVVDFGGPSGLPPGGNMLNFGGPPNPMTSSKASGSGNAPPDESVISLIQSLLQQLSQLLAQLTNPQQGNDASPGGAGGGSGKGGGAQAASSPQADQPPAVDTSPAPPSAPSFPSPASADSPQASTPVNPTSASNVAPADALDVTKFGAVGDGKTDNTEALNQVMKAAKEQNKSVFIPEGTFNHSGVINADGVSVKGAGMGTELHATDPDHSAIKLTGTGAGISDLKTTVNAPSRSSQPDAAGILLQGTSQASVSNCMTVGAGSNGIRLDGASGSTIANNVVTGSNADGIAMMNGSVNNHVTNNLIDQAGDDAISSDSYVGDAKQNRGNLVENNAIQDNRYGRAAVSMGGADDVFRNNFVRNAPDHSVMAGGTDANSDTMQGSGSVFEGNHVNDGNYPDPQTLLGWNPGQLAAASTYTDYAAGTGAGANNTSGNRT